MVVVCGATLASLAVLPFASQAQVGSVVPLLSAANMARRGTNPYFETGNYQLADGTWQRAKLLREEDNLVVMPPEKKDGPRQEFPAEQVWLYTTATDTFRVVRNIVLPKLQSPVSAGFVRQLYRGGEFFLGNYVYFRNNTAVAHSYQLLTRRNEPAVVLPSKSSEFRQVMLTYVGDHPLLAKQLAKGLLGPTDAKAILEWYVRWQQNSPVAPDSKP